MGAGSVSNDKQPEPLVPGSAVSAILVRGDMNIAGTCTVTYLDDTHLLACGHPLLQSGNVDMPMTKATVLATLPSPANSFKIINTTEPVGAFVQDRRAGIMGRFDREPHMIPVTLTFHGTSHPKQFHYEVLNNAKITPAAMMATVFNAIQGMNEYGEDTTYRLRGEISVLGYPKLSVKNMYAPADGTAPTAYGIALSIGEHFSRIFENPYERPKIEGVELDFDLVPDRRSARLETARTDVTEARPGDEITIEALLRPYRGESILRQVPVKIPTSTPKGTLRILVSDGDTLDKMRRIPANMSRRLDLASTIAMLNKEHSNSQVYVSLMEANPQAMVDDKVMPTLPLSVMNVMDGLRGSQDMVVVGESAVDEASAPVDYVVTGSQIITPDHQVATAFRGQFVRGCTETRAHVERQVADCTAILATGFLTEEECCFSDSSTLNCFLQPKSQLFFTNLMSGLGIEAARAPFPGFFCTGQFFSASALGWDTRCCTISTQER